jgi:hypothetical protein
VRLPLSLHLSFPCGSPKGYVGMKVNSTVARHQVAEILDLIQTDLLSQSRLDQKSRGHHCSPYVYEFYEVLPLVALSRCAYVVATSRSTRPCGQLRQLHYQGLCGSVIHAFGLQGYAIESLANRYSIPSRLILGVSGLRR